MKPNTDLEDTKTNEQHISKFKKCLKITAITLFSLIGLVIIAVVGLNLYLTPARLASIINNNASRYINAKVHVGRVSHSIWSSFPYLNVEIDTVYVLPDKLDPRFNENFKTQADTLFYSTKIEGGLNIFKIIGHKIVLKDIITENLKLNIAVINDSVNNFSIIPPDEIEKLKDFKIKGLSLRSFNMKGLTSLRFLSASPSVSASVNLSKIEMSNLSNDNYKLSVSGIGFAETGLFPSILKLPFLIDGKLVMPQDLSRLGLNDFIINLGGTTAEFDISARIDENIAIDSFQYKVPGLDIGKIYSLLPDQWLEKSPLTDIDLIIKSNGRLLSPFVINKDSLPNFYAELFFQDGKLGIKGPKSDININNLVLSATLTNEKLSDKGLCLDVKKFKSSVENINMELTANINDILGEKARCNVAAIITAYEKNEKVKAANNNFAVSGGLTGKIDFNCTVNQLVNNPEINDAVLNITSDIDKLRFNIPDGTDISIGKGLIKLSADAFDINKNGIDNGNIDFSINLTDNRIKTSQLTADVSDIDISGLTAVPLALDFNSGEKYFPSLDIIAIVSKGFLNIPQSNSNVKFSGLKADMSSKTKRVSANVRLSNLEAGEKSMKLTLSDIISDVSLKKETDIFKMLTSSTKKIIKSLKTSDLSVKFKIEKGKLATVYFPSDNILSNLDIAVTPDLIALKDLRLHTGGCGIHLNGNISEPLNFIANPENPTVNLKMNLDIDTLDINRLARIYENGVKATQGVAATLPSPKPAEVAPEDTVTWAIPKFINASLNAKANHLIYTDLDVTDVSTLISVANGVADLSDLKLHTPFASAKVDVTYSTENIDDMYLSFNADVNDVVLTNLFDCYKNTLLKKMPYLTNFYGVLSAKADGKISIFPTNYLDIPSLTANVGFEGRKLFIHQNDFIRKIAHLLLIRKKGDLQIQNIDIKARVHDNLVELDPFTFQLDRYKIISGGLNNFDGDMFYHIGIVHSIVPFPFGVNILGSFTHPKIRFGGASLKPSDSEKVSSEIMEDIRVNLPQNLKYNFIEFIKKASMDYEGTSE